MTRANILFVVALLPSIAIASIARGESSAVESSAAETSAAKTEPEALPGVVLVHRPHHNAEMGKDLRFVALVDNEWRGSAFVLRYRQTGSATDYAEVAFERSSSGGYFAKVPGRDVQRPSLEYYIASKDLEGLERLHFASSQQPHRVSVDIDTNLRWSQAERERLVYVNSVDLYTQVQDFGNRYNKSDNLLRSEIRWTHKLLHGSQFRLYSIHLGFGAIRGRTPASQARDAVSDKTAARYGFGGLRLQISPSVSLAGETILGVDRDELITGVRTELTLGKRWQSNLSFGAEQIQRMGPSIWMRLQWDTVEPLLMSVSIVKTDLPGAILSGGTYSAYDLAYPFSPRIKLRASVSFGSRDGPGNLGAGFGSTLAF